MDERSPRLDSLSSRRFPVVVVGAGPAGLTVGDILRAAGLECLVLEAESREFIERRPRAGVIEERAVRGPERQGLARSLLKRAGLHTACEFRSELYHGSAAGDPFRAGTTVARLRRLFSSPAAAFAEQYLGTAARY
ncbi:flavin-dependent dehydrogenase [Streptomyces sp. SAI-229]|jgi:flavin-dependent dehydrogenase